MKTIKAVAAFVLVCGTVLCGQARPQPPEAFGKLPMSFQANAGQVVPDVKFLSRGRGYELYLTGQAATLALHKNDSHQTAVVNMRLVRGHQSVPAGEDPLPGAVNYLIGNDPAKWHIAVPTFSKVRYRSVYPGIDLIYYGNQTQLEYDF